MSSASATGFVMSNSAQVITVELVGVSGLILTRVMCRTMNRSLANVLFSVMADPSRGPVAAGSGRRRSRSMLCSRSRLDAHQQVLRPGQRID